MDGTDLESSTPSVQRHTPAAIRDHCTGREAGTEPGVSALLYEVCPEHDRPSEDSGPPGEVEAEQHRPLEGGAPPDEVHAEQDRPKLKFISGGPAATVAWRRQLLASDVDEERPWWLASDADEEFRRRFCVPDEAIAWLASGDEAFAGHYAGSDGKENRRLDALYPNTSKVPGLAWAATTERLGDACSRGQVRSYRGGEPLKPKFWLVRDVTDQDVADVLFDREDLRQLLADKSSGGKDGPAEAAARSSQGKALAKAVTAEAAITSPVTATRTIAPVKAKRGRPPNKYWSRLDLLVLVETDLEEYGIPEPGDSRQARLECKIKDELAKTDIHPAESTIRRWVKEKINDFRKRLEGR